ncbi:MAG: hypothetical protein JXA89_04335 [Anaerolineae bacterium]|nr:hypothetical protein [Anaerolineae bacterium]
MNRSRLRERYLQDEWPRQVGNLASTLTRLSSRTQDARFDHIVADLLREGAVLMEWSAPCVPLELAAEMAEMQRELVLWHRVWPSDTVRSLLAFRARSMADSLLESAGFV